MFFNIYFRTSVFYIEWTSSKLNWRTCSRQLLSISAFSPRVEQIVFRFVTVALWRFNLISNGNMLSAKYTIQRSIWLIIHVCMLQNKNSTSETTFMCERIWFPITCFTLKSLKTLWQFFTWHWFYSTYLLYIPFKVTAVQTLQQYFPHYCKNVDIYIFVEDTKCAISIAVVLLLTR